MQYNFSALTVLQTGLQQQYGLQQQNMTAEQRAILAQQQLGARCYDQSMYGGYGTNPFGWPFQ
jgi:hypothetical protein